MKGLILKYFYNLKQSILIYFCFAILVFLIYNYVKVPLPDLSLSIALSILILTTNFKTDFLEINNFNKFAIISPLNKKDIIKAKYICYVLTIFLIFLFSFILSFFIKEPFTEILPYKIIIGYPIFMCSVIVYFSIQHIIFIYLNKNLVLFGIATFLSIFLTIIIVFAYSFPIIIFCENLLNQNIYLYFISIITLLLTFIILFISYKISCFKYNKTYY